MPISQSDVHHNAASAESALTSAALATGIRAVAVNAALRGGPAHSQ